MARYERRLRARQIAVRLSIVAAALCALHVIAMSLYWTDAEDSWDFDLRWDHVSIFDLDTEESFGTWFQTMMLMFASGLLFMQARARKKLGDGLWRYWHVLAIGFGFLSLDEVAGIHEWVNEHTEPLWTRYGAMVAGVVGVAYLPFLWMIERRTARLFALAGLVYLGGELGIEHMTEFSKTLEYNLWNTLEEGMGMYGVILFLYALLSHMAGGPRTALWQSTAIEEKGAK